MKLSEGVRDHTGKWHPTNPADYPPLDAHGIWPWSTLDMTSTAWQARKKWWKTRPHPVDAPQPRQHAAGMINTGRHGKTSGGLSLFDPVLAELMYTWFAPPHGSVLDPMAGGPVRGIVAAHLGRLYTGVDLSADQVKANYGVATLWDLIPHPRWVIGDARQTITAVEQYDYVLTCPPYHNRERYSDHPDDLSNMRWDAFLDAHQQILTATARALKNDRFATWAISDVRDHKGHYRGLPAIVTQQAKNAGLHLINDQVLIEPAGLRAKTTRPPWEANRTTTRRHQHVLTFVKGDRREATRVVTGC